MLRGLFPRLFSQFREGGIITGRFSFTNSGGWVAQSGTYVGLSVADTTTGTATLTLRGGARSLVVLDAHIENADPTDVTDARFVQVDAPNAGNGTVVMRLIGLEDAADDIADPVDNSVLVVTLYVDH